MPDLKKIVAITGASSGIGDATACHLASLGAKVVLGARGIDRLSVVAEKIRASGNDAAHIAIDVTRRADLAALVSLAKDRYGRLDALVSCAGSMPISKIDDLAVDDWDQMIDVNIKGTLYGIAAALPVFREQRAGHFVNIASTAARKTVPGQSVYSCTKAAILALSDGLRQELAGQIRVTVISPGFTDTNFIDHVKDQALRASLREAGSKFAMPAERVAEAVAYALEQPDSINVGEIVIRSAAQP